VITINLLGKTLDSLELEWEINDILAARKGHERWGWVFENRPNERFPYCITGESDAGRMRYLFDEDEVLLELAGADGTLVEIEGTHDPKGDIRVRVGGEEFDSRGMLLDQGNPFLPENLYGLITLAIRASRMPTESDVEAYRQRLAEAVRFGRKKLRAVNRYFAAVVKKIMPARKQKKKTVPEFRKILKSVDFPLGSK